MSSPFIPIGFANLVNTERLIAIVTADSSPARRMIQDARDTGVLIDASGGRKTRSVLVMDSEHLVTSTYTCSELADILQQAGKAVPVLDTPTEEVP